MRLGKRPPEVPSNSGFLAYALIQPQQHLALTGILPSLQIPLQGVRVASSRALQGTSHCAASAGDWAGLAKTRPFTLLGNFCLQWLAFAILHNHTEPPPELYFTTLACLLYCHHVSSPLIMFHLLLSFLCFPWSSSLVERSQTPHELSLSASVSCPQQALNRLPFLHGCPADFVRAFWSLTLQDVS